VLLGLWLAAGALVTLLPPLLPPVEYSSFFHKGLLQEPAPTDLLRTFVPDNIFTALANDNFPAVVLFSSVLGVLMQGLEGRDQLLQTLELLRRLFARMNRATARIIPFGILALSALNSSRLELAQLVRMQGLLLLCLSALLLISGLLTGLILAITPLTPAALWRIVRGPLAFTASSGNLLVALPLLLGALQEELPRARAALDGAGASPTAADRERALELAQACEAMNRQRRELCDAIEAEALALVEADGPQRAPFLLLAQGHWHHGVIGIVASRLAPAASPSSMSSRPWSSAGICCTSTAATARPGASVWRRPTSRPSRPG